MWLFVYLIVGFIVSAAIALVLPRRVCLGLATIALGLGILLPALVWGYASLFVHGDNSAYGMLGTICVILFAPAGFLLALFGMLKTG
jgi:hypothetical protein